MADPDRLLTQEMLIRAAHGLGKVDKFGPRGVTLVTANEIEAMALLLAIFGLVPVLPGAPIPERLIVPPQKDT